MDLYYVSYASSDDSSGYLHEFVVASSESEAEDAVIKMYRGSGLSKNDIVATLVEVEGYAISVTPTTK